MRVVAVPEPAAQGSPRWGFCDLVLGSLAEFDADALQALEGGAGSDLTAGVSRAADPGRRPWARADRRGIGCSRLQNADPASVGAGPGR